MKTICIIQARVGSSRFKGKILREINNKKIIEIIYERLKKSKFINDFVIAIPDTKENDILNNFLLRKNFKVFRGSEKNVLERYYLAAKMFKARVIIRVTSDCPFINHKIIDDHIKIYFRKKKTILSNYLSKSYPLGISFSICDLNSLRVAYKNAKDPKEIEHVMPYIYKNFKSSLIKTRYKSNLNRVRLTLDYPADFITIRKIFNKFSPKILFDWEEILKIQKKEKSLFKDNFNCVQKK